MRKLCQMQTSVQEFRSVPHTAFIANSSAFAGDGRTQIVERGSRDAMGALKVDGSTTEERGEL